MNEIVRKFLCKASSPLLLAVVLFYSPSAASAETFVDNFDSGSISNLLVPGSSPGFSLSLSEGRLYFEKATGAGNGRVFLETMFCLVGDFGVTVKAQRIRTSPEFETGLVVDYPTGDSFTDVFFFTGAQIHANIIVPPINTWQGVWNSSTETTFRIRRVGNQILAEYDAGAGFQLLHTASHPNLAAPVRVRLFLLEEYGDTNGSLGAFDDLEITADRFEYPAISVEGTSWGRIKQLLGG